MMTTVVPRSRTLQELLTVCWEDRMTNQKDIDNWQNGLKKKKSAVQSGQAQDSCLNRNNQLDK